jgi:hypothetical protein
MKFPMLTQGILSFFRSYLANVVPSDLGQMNLACSQVGFWTLADALVPKIATSCHVAFEPAQGTRPRTHGTRWLNVKVTS